MKMKKLILALCVLTLTQNCYANNNSLDTSTPAQTSIGLEKLMSIQEIEVAIDDYIRPGSIKPIPKSALDSLEKHIDFFKVYADNRHLGVKGILNALETAMHEQGIGSIADLYVIMLKKHIVKKYTKRQIIANYKARQ